MTTTGTPRSTGEMMTDIMGNVGNLVRSEVDLARAEIAGSMKKATGTLALMALAVVLAISGLNVLAASLVLVAVWAGLPLHWATLIVGVALLAIALVIFLSARSALQHIGFVPSRTARNVQRDVSAIKDAFNDN